MELLAGAREDRREVDLRRLLLRFELLAFDPVSDFDALLSFCARFCRLDNGRCAAIPGWERASRFDSARAW
jgi:hypothetical protein